GLVAGQHLGQHLALVGPQAQQVPHGQRSTAAVARDHAQPHALLAQGFQRRSGAGLGFVTEHEQGHRRPDAFVGAGGQHRHRAALVLQHSSPLQQGSVTRAQ
ncbi:hypothetical protein RZS08_66690, partial [Arthrospira platensis SPKY1]|nr:hypothetical protein [Arthrospira platensis SPKY1]